MQSKLSLQNVVTLQKDSKWQMTKKNQNEGEKVNQYNLITKQSNLAVAPLRVT